MAKKKKKSRAGEINFYKAMTVLGLVIAGVFIYMFFESAPNLSTHDFHVATDTAGKCMTCHMAQDKNAPIMPHRPMEDCGLCHESQ